MPASSSVEANPSRLDVVTGILATLLGFGFFIDLWAHSHGRVDDSFFTLWHALLYAAAGLFGGVLLEAALRGRRNGTTLLGGLPRGYDLAFLGSALFLAAGLADMVWHLLFGIEENVDALLSPTHLALAASGMMMVFGPVRSAWFKGQPTAFPDWLPWVAAMATGLAILGAFTQYVHPAMDTWPEAVPDVDTGRSDIVFVSADGTTQTRISIEGAEQGWMPDVAADGRIVASAVVGETGRLVVMEADGSMPRVIHEGEAFFHHSEWSPDGSQIAFTDDVDGNAEIFVIGSDGDDLTRLTNAQGADWGPTWSPDGSEIVFTSDRDGVQFLYRIPSSGGQPVRLTDTAALEGAPAYSPNGELLAFERNTSGNWDIALVRPDGSDLIVLTTSDAADIAPAWSPDGTQIVFASDRDGTFDLFAMGVDGSDIRNLTQDPRGHEGWAGSSWSADMSVIATNASGHIPFWMDSHAREVLGVAALLVQASLIGGFVLLVLRHGPLPLGSITVLVGLSGALMTVMSDNYWYIGVAVLAGIIGDVVAFVMRPIPAQPGRIRVVAFLVPAVWYAIYLVAIALSDAGIGWSIHMTLGAPVLAGMVGLLMSFLAFPGAGSTPAEALWEPISQPSWDSNRRD
jgi:Tol biopolymer transport system component